MRIPGYRAGAFAVSVVALVALLAGGTARGQEPFTDTGAGLTGVHDCSLAWGDYDNDGDLELSRAGRSRGQG